MENGQVGSRTPRRRGPVTPDERIGEPILYEIVPSFIWFVRGGDRTTPRAMLCGWERPPLVRSHDFPSASLVRRMTAPARRTGFRRYVRRSAVLAARCAMASRCRSPVRRDT